MSIDLTEAMYLNPWDPELGLLVDAGGDIVRSNDSATQELTHFSRHELLPHNHQALVSACRQQRRAINQVESRCGEHIWLWTYLPMPEGDGVIVKGRNATQDVRTLDEATRASRLYRLITENTTDLISRHTPEGRFIDASPAAWRLLGYWPEELRGRALEDIFQSRTLAQQLETSRNQLRDEGYATMTLELLHRDGRRRWFEIASRAIRETYTGAVVEFISVSRDITARVESQESARRLADELAHTSRLAALGELASSIAHEMNQPLATIVNFASASQRYLQQAEQQPERLQRVNDGLERIISHANRAAEVIKRLRAFLRKGDKRTAAIAVNDIISNAVQLCQWDADQRGIVLHTELCEQQPIITADPVLLEQVLINLIRNAIDATQALQEHPSTSNDNREPPADRIVIRSLWQAEDVRIDVIDHGIGIDDEGLRMMFNPFFTRKSDGLGLGLSMSRSIIEGIGGFLDASPAPTRGLILTCRFPHATTRPMTAAEILRHEP
ncbi:MAG: PAS domain S-box protein [Bacterioplanes sp.]|nr:PAS domain S-box protein [Bacterioplanes sp.]